MAGRNAGSQIGPQNENIPSKRGYMLAYILAQRISAADKVFFEFLTVACGLPVYCASVTQRKPIVPERS
jgi:hypothetical protein